MIDVITPKLSLAARLRERIERDGPITFRDWMAAALYDAEEGYYRRERVRWGREGDYRTSPERSELFAATFARYFAQLYDQLGHPKTWTIFEAGAGAGGFAEVLLQTLEHQFPQVFVATSYLIDELGSHSRAAAAQGLKRFGDRVQFTKIADLDQFSGVVFSNELLDAFPIHRLIKREKQLREFYVGVKDDRTFEWVINDPTPGLSERLENYLPTLVERMAEGQIFEVSPDIQEWLEQVNEKLHSGYIVSVDYGFLSEKSGPRETLRGFRRHQFVEDLLANPGEHDVTASVDWSFVKSVGIQLGLRELSLERLDKFLLAAGVLDELELLSKQAESDAERLRLSRMAREMIMPDGMAASFQVLVQERIRNVNS
jgi:SAM-dependent MidA family methyltransferase